jgi:hypothetical protein
MDSEDVEDTAVVDRSGEEAEGEVYAGALSEEITV